MSEVPLYYLLLTNPGVSWLIDVVRSHEKRRWLFEEPTQSQISTSILKYTTNKPRLNQSPPL